MGWLIFLGIILLIIVLLALPVHIVIDRNEKLTIKVRYLFFTFVIVPSDKKEKEPKEKKAKPEEQPKKAKTKKPKKKRTPEEMIDGFVKAVNEYGPGAKMILKNLRVHKMEGFWKIAAEGAAACGIRYGRICALLNTAFGFLRNFVKIEKAKLRVYPDFTAETEEIRVLADIEANPIVVLIGAIRIAFVYLKNMFNKQKQENLKRSVHK